MIDSSMSYMSDIFIPQGGVLFTHCSRPTPDFICAIPETLYNLLKLNMTMLYFVFKAGFLWSISGTYMIIFIAKVSYCSEIER